MTNTAPVFSNLDATPTYTEQGSPVVIDANATVADAELDALNGGLGNYSGASLTVSALFHGGYDFGSNVFLGGMPNVSVNGSELQVGGITIATLGFGINPLRITFTDANGVIPTTALVNEILQAVAYSNSNDSVPTSVTLEYVLADNSAPDPLSTTGTVNLTVTPVNDAAPELSGVDSAPRSYTERAAPFAIFPTTTVSDIDFNLINDFSGLEIKVTSSLGDGSDVFGLAPMGFLSIDGSTIKAGTNVVANVTSGIDSISIVFTDANGTLATAAIVNEVLQAITYANTSHQPLDTPTLSLEVNDHDATNPRSSGAFVQVDITPVNEAPTLGGDLAGIVAFNGAHVLTTADLTAVDLDNAPAELTFTASNLVGGTLLVNGFPNSSFTLNDLDSGLVRFVHDGASPTASFDVAVEDFNQDGSPPVAQTFTLTVDNVNDAPVLTSGGGASTWSTTVNENSTVQLQAYDDPLLTESGVFAFSPPTASGSAAAIVTATDPEEGPLTFQIVGGTDAALFSFDATALVTTGASGALYFLNPPGHSGYNGSADFEAAADSNGDNIYEVIVRVGDGVNTVDQTVLIQVQNVDEAPVFAGGASAQLFAVAEGTTSVGAIGATDPEGAAVTYMADNPMFAIDANTGALSFNFAPVYNFSNDPFANLYSVGISASDGAHASFQYVFVRVTNPSNTAPTLTGIDGQTAISVAENHVPSGWTLGVTDSQGQAFHNGLVFSIVGGADAALFSSEAIGNGVLSFVTPPDHEAPTDAGLDNTYDVIVRVTDEFGVGLHDDKTISITVGAAATTNHAPTITGLSSPLSGFVAQTPENIPAIVGPAIGAFDPDGETSGNGLTWSIVLPGAGGAADGGAFVIDANSGMIGFATSPDFETPLDANHDNIYVVTVKVTDAGGLSDLHDFTVQVTDLPDGGGGGGNTAPVISNLDAAVIASPNGPAILLDINVDISDAELDAIGTGGNYSGATLTVQRQGGAVASDEFSWNTGPLLLAGFELLGANNEIWYGANLIATRDTQAGNGTMAITFQPGATSAMVDTIVRAITYRNASSSTADITLEYAVNDGAGGTATDTIVVSAAGGGGNAGLITFRNGASTAIAAVVENKTAVTAITGTHDYDDAGGLVFSIAGGLDAAKFSIDPVTGALAFLAAPDYETPGDADGDNIYEIAVKAETQGPASGLYDTQAVFIAVANVEGVTLTGTSGANQLQGGIEEDRLLGLGGNDTLVGRGGGDTLDGGLGGDTASYANASSGVSAVLGLKGLGGDAAGDVFIAIENLLGSNFADVLGGNGGANRISGGSGNDTIGGGAGNDVLNGGAGIDLLSYEFDEAGVKVSLALTTMQNTVGSGKDTVLGFENLDGSAFGDTLSGSAVGNQIRGKGGNDRIDGKAGNDALLGDAGSDTLIGGAGNDTLTGGTGEEDHFLFNTALNGLTNRDLITDFETGIDKIDLARTIFTKVGAAGDLSVAAFALTSETATAATRILYDATTGALYYDSDGSGAAARVQFATLTAGLSVGAGNFGVV